jgi:excisionase family DNA binding protein
MNDDQPGYTGADLAAGALEAIKRRPVDDGLLTVAEAADLLRLPPGTLRTWRSLNRGPKSLKLGRRVLYRRGDVVEWLRAEELRTARGDGV